MLKGVGTLLLGFLVSILVLATCSVAMKGLHTKSSIEGQVR